MLIEQGVVRVGMEIEVAEWTNRTYQEVCADLIDAQYMIGPPEIWEEHHGYHCSCERGGCRIVRQGHLLDHPLVSMTYDASLPKHGAEFITSPVLMANFGLNQLKEIWNIVTHQAEWRDDQLNYYEEYNCSPSVHMHVSATLNNKYMPASHSTKQDIMHALELFSPELFAIADLTKYRRKLNFRWPTREAIEKDDNPNAHHHGFIHVREWVPERISYIEWRLFEAAYDDWDYILATTYLSAVITRALLDVNVLNSMMNIGYQYPVNRHQLNNAITTQSVGSVINCLDPDRIMFLEDLCIKHIEDDPDGTVVLKRIFKQLEESI